MKVGTDGVLLGAWVDVRNTARILDIGTGTGLIALMLAQRCRARITGIDPVVDSYEESRLNFEQSPWKDRLRAVHSDFQGFSERARKKKTEFDLVVSNPPFHRNSRKPPDKSRSVARHDADLTFRDILTGCSGILSGNGRLAIIYPASLFEFLLAEAELYHFYPFRVMWVFPRTGSREKRVLIEFGTIRKTMKVDSLTIEMDGRHRYSEEYKRLTRDFYLDF